MVKEDEEVDIKDAEKIQGISPCIFSVKQVLF